MQEGLRDAASEVLDSTVPKMVVSVMNLKYSPSDNIVATALKSDEAAVLENVTFSVNGGELMAILAPRDAERRTLMELISNRRRYGEFDGEVLISQFSGLTPPSSVDNNGNNNTNPDRKDEFIGVTISESMAFVPRDAVSLYLPGLTYYETLSYAARLRMRNSTGLNSSEMDAARESRIADILEVMNLSWCQDRVIAHRPTARGSLGGELRKMAVAVEIISLPSVIVLADVTEGLDAAVSAELVSTLASLASRGHTVISSFPKIYPGELHHFHKVTLVSKGYSIYSSSPKNISSYFSGINFDCPPATDAAQFLLDVGNGTERPVGERRPAEANALQAHFEESEYYQQYRTASTAAGGSSYTSTVLHVYKGGFASRSDLARGLRNSLIAMERAWYCKFKEVEVLQKSLAASVILSVFFGYFGWRLGSASDYCVHLIPLPYSETSTTTSIMYMCTALQIGMQILNVHIFNQKQKVFLYERAGGVVSLPGYICASLVTEIPLAAFFSLIFSTIVFFMVDLGTGLEEYLWWLGVMQMNTCIAVLTVLMFTSVIKHELLVRDWFLFCFVSMIWTGGFIYPLGVIDDWVNKISNINPLRWIFMSVMVWKWEDYPDGSFYLGTYDYDHFQKDDIWIISFYFVVVGVGVYVAGLVQLPSTLRRSEHCRSVTSPSRESQAEADVAYQKKIDSLKRPSIISRDSSFSSSSQKLSSQASTATGEGMARGPRVTFANLAYQVPDVGSPLGKKTIIHPMSGLFDWGKLGVIMGAAGCGKSSLLHILGNQPLGSNAELKGNIFHDDWDVEDVPLLPWQRCAFIEALDEHLRDLTVLDILTYAMLLRTDEELPDHEVQKNVNNVLKLLQLEELMNSKAKELSEGALRRLTIAEDLVHGPHLILMDEPTTSLDPREASIIMTHTIRELVNQDRTVIVTLHQPSAAVFDLCDTLVLLSKGRLIYAGNVADAANFFLQSPTMPLKLDVSFENPADFLYCVSANKCCDDRGEQVDAPRLENSYKGSSLCMLFIENHMKPLHARMAAACTHKERGDFVSTSNPMTRLSVGQTGTEAQDNHSSMTDPEDGWRFASSVDTTRSRSRSMSNSTTTSSSSLPSSLLQPSPGPGGRRTVFANSLLLACRRVIIPLLATIQDLKETNFAAQRRKASVLNRRAFWALFKREKLVIGTTLMYIYIAIFTCIILHSNLENNPGVITAIAMFGAFLLLVSQLQYVFFLFNNQKVFLKEHSRGLYSAFLRWLVEDTPLLLLRFCQGLMYAVVVHQWMGYQGGERGLYFSAMVVLVTIAFTMLVQIVVSTLPDLRTSYGSLLSIAFLLFIFSGLIFKPAILPYYLGPWLPSVSIIRWFGQGIFINEFEDNTEAFPPLPLLGGRNIYPLYLSLFGWGGKTKWFCMYVVALNLAVFKVLVLLVSWRAVIGDKGKRCMRRKEIEDRIY